MPLFTFLTNFSCVFTEGFEWSYWMNFVYWLPASLKLVSNSNLINQNIQSLLILQACMPGDASAYKKSTLKSQKLSRKVISISQSAILRWMSNFKWQHTSQMQLSCLLVNSCYLNLVINMKWMFMLFLWYLFGFCCLVDVLYGIGDKMNIIM